MLRTDKTIYKVILVLNLLFIVAGVAICAIGMASPDANLTRILFRVSAIACLVFAGFYIVSGYRKNAAKYYKVYGAIYAVEHLIGILSGIAKSGTPFGIAVLTLTLVITLVLLLSENLGKTKSFVLCGLLVILGVVLIFHSLSQGNIPTILIMSNIVNVDLACLYGIMTYAKYLDKTERGTK